MERYAALLATDGVHRGLIGPREANRLWDRHLLNCAAIEPLLPESGAVVDLGSGAGLPGLVIAIQRPGLLITLLESQQRRTAFLNECVAELGLTNVSVVRARAEQAAGLLVADAIVARAVAPLARLARWAIPLLRPGGRLLAMKGDTAQRELHEAMPLLRDLGVADARVVGARLSVPEAHATVVVLTMSDTGA